jgi:hypothetical protein
VGGQTSRVPWTWEEERQHPGQMRWRDVNIEQVIIRVPEVEGDVDVDVDADCIELVANWYRNNVEG